MLHLPSFIAYDTERLALFFYGFWKQTRFRENLGMVGDFSGSPRVV